MLVHLIVLAFVIQINCSTICDLKSCVCWYENEENQDFVGESVQCSYSETDIMKTNYTLPEAVHSLDLSSNNLSAIQSSSLLKSTTLKELFLNNNVLTDIAVDSFHLPELRRLDLSNNLLEFIDKETFRGLTKLEYLDLANNRFTTFTKLTFHHLSNLNGIILDNNQIGPSLEGSNLFDRSGFGLTNKVKSISISGIKLVKVPDNFLVDAYDLRKLIISNNSITDIFDIPFTLEYLDLSDNPINEISGEDFDDLIALKVLKLNNLQIKEAPEYVFESLCTHSLKTLELERNRFLTRFDQLAFGRNVLVDPDIFVLERLSLKGSRLSQLDEGLAAPFGQLVELDLQGNPWKCDCKIVWIKELVISDEYSDHVRCATPSPLFNARIFDLKNKYFSCESRYNGFIIAVVSFCAILSVMALWIFICLPRRQTRSSFLSELYSPATAYSILPMATTYSSEVRR